MAKEEVLELDGKVTKMLPDAMFKVELPNGKIMPGDRVKLQISPYSLDRARIIYRYK